MSLRKVKTHASVSAELTQVIKDLDAAWTAVVKATQLGEIGMWKRRHRILTKRRLALINELKTMRQDK